MPDFEIIRFCQNHWSLMHIFGWPPPPPPPGSGSWLSFRGFQFLILFRVTRGNRGLSQKGAAFASYSGRIIMSLTPPVLMIRIRDWVPVLPLDPGSGMRESQRPDPGRTSRIILGLETIFLLFWGSGIRVRDSLDPEKTSRIRNTAPRNTWDHVSLYF
jgi:hypothetical protein